ncbi:MAG: hypothetical protein IJX68_04740 [Rikenellaceae bacterium]|nr:hypothetical protein [Rikenellaceae bacterium]
MTNKLTTAFRSHCNEYARQVADLLGYSEWRWVGVGDQGDGTYETLELGDWLYLSLSDCQTIIDRLDEWVKRYGSRAAVAEEVESWQEWWLNDDDDPDNTAAVITLWESRRERYLRTYPRLNLEHWLLGCPRDRPTESPHDRLRRLKVTRELITELCQQYRPQQSLWNIIDSLTADIKTAQADCDRLDAELREQMKHSQAYKDFQQAVSDHQDNHDNF